MEENQLQWTGGEAVGTSLMMMTHYQPSDSIRTELMGSSRENSTSAVVSE